MKSLEDITEELLLYMSVSEPAKNSISRVKLSYFNDAEPFIPEFYEALQKADPSQENRSWFRSGEVKETDLSRPLDVAVLGTIGDDNSPLESRKDKFHVSRIRRLRPAEVRGKVSKFVREMYEHTFAGIIDDGKVVARQDIVGVRGDTVIDLHSNGFELIPEHRADVLKLIRFAPSIQFNRRYEWRVSMGFLGSPTLAFATDPTGAREVFKLRDIPNGKTRRDALRHWVKEHWRKQRVDGDETKVREHLRGSTTFTWNGLLCKITPSELDLEKSQALAK